MALVKLGALAQDVRGSLAGQVFSRNRGGQYVRQKVAPVQPVSRFSSTVRAIFRAVAQRWSCTLTAAQRAAWEAWAQTHQFINVFGDSIVLGGVAIYQAVNNRLAMVGEDYLDDPPETWSAQDLGVCTITATVAAGVLTASATIGRDLEDDEGLMLYCTPPLLGGRNPQKNDYRLVNLNSLSSFQAADPLGPSIQGRFEDVAFAVGDRLALMLAAINKETGAMSTPVTILKTLTAPAG